MSAPNTWLVAAGSCDPPGENGDEDDLPSVNPLFKKSVGLLVRQRMKVSKGLKVQGKLFANDVLRKAKANAQQQVKTKLADVIPDSSAFVVLFQGVEKGSKVRLDPTCHEKRT